MNPTVSPTAGRPESEKVRSMFSQIAGRYDLANNVLSGGIHHLWRQDLVDWSGAKWQELSNFNLAVGYPF